MAPLPLTKTALDGVRRQGTGTCICSDKCTCTNITFLIFQTGNIITMGFKKTEQIKEIIDHFLVVCNSLKTIIEKKKFL